MSRIATVLAILRRIGRGPVGVDVVAEDVGIDRSNAQRTIDGLIEAGLPIEETEVATGRRPRREYRLTKAALDRWFRELA